MLTVRRICQWCLQVGGGGTIKNGRFLKYRRNYSLSKYHLATMQRMGVGVEEFADAESPMSGLTKDV